jgi:guanylate cyclase
VQASTTSDVRRPRRGLRLRDGGAERLPRLIAWLASLGVAPEDSDDERLRKASLTLASVLIATMAVAWVTTYWVLDLWRSGAIPFAYQLATVALLIVFARTRNFGLYRTAQLAMMLVLPFLLQASIGGFRPSSAVVLWAIIAPLGALIVGDLRRATPWFIAFLAEVLVLGLVDSSLTGEGHVPQGVIVTFFVLNVVGVSTTIYLLLRYFIGERERIQAELEVEQDRSERLLLNVLPAPIATRLKEGPDVIADHFDDVTVLFADIVGFTPFADSRSPADVVAVLNEIFSAFDDLADHHGLEKIKTIGDAYMVVAGLPVPRADHEAAVAEMALDMRAAVKKLGSERGVELSIRVGIDSGPVVAGVIGRRKFSYDVWGSTVNMASRMESHGVADGIQVTERVYERLRERFEFSERGPIEVKGIGSTNAYLLLRPRANVTNRGEQ